MKIEIRTVVTSGMSIDWKGPEEAGNVGYMNVYICVHVKIQQAVHLWLVHLKISTIYCVTPQ